MRGIGEGLEGDEEEEEEEEEEAEANVELAELGRAGGLELPGDWKSLPTPRAEGSLFNNEFILLVSKLSWYHVARADGLARVLFEWGACSQTKRMGQSTEL